MTDPDAPCSTTKDGKNPWPAIWAEAAAEDLKAGREPWYPPRDGNEQEELY